MSQEAGPLHKMAFHDKLMNQLMICAVAFWCNVLLIVYWWLWYFINPLSY